MTNISQMKAELIKNGVSASAVESMTEQQLINACKERNIKIQETLNQNANWGRGDEVEISTGKQQVDPYTQKYNRAVEKKDEALAASWKYLKEGNLGLAFSYLGDAVERGYDVSTMPKDMKDAYTQKGSALKLLGVGALLGLFASSCEGLEPEPEPELVTESVIVETHWYNTIKQLDIKFLSKKSLEDINKFLDNAVLRLQNRNLKEQNEYKNVKQQYKNITLEQQAAINKDDVDKLHKLHNKVQQLTSKIESIEKDIKETKTKLDILNNNREKFMQELNQTTTLQEREAVFNKEEYHQFLLSLD